MDEPSPSGVPLSQGLAVWRPCITALHTTVVRPYWEAGTTQ
jgi:hypothetical protein